MTKFKEKGDTLAGARLPRKKTKAEIKKINFCYDVNVEAYAELELEDLKKIDTSTLSGTKLAAFKDTLFYKTIEKMQDDAKKAEELKEDTVVEVTPEIDPLADPDDA
jgi:hypothetical protein